MPNRPQHRLDLEKPHLVKKSTPERLIRGVCVKGENQISSSKEKKNEVTAQIYRAKGQEQTKAPF
jgi:hypothetical protein